MMCCAVVAPQGKRRALLVGINYAGTKSALSGCVQDTMNIRKLLVEVYGWEDNSDTIRCLCDTVKHCKKPTKKNILEVRQRLTQLWFNSVSSSCALSSVYFLLQSAGYQMAYGFCSPWRCFGVSIFRPWQSKI